VVVNDVGRSLDGEEAMETTAEQVVAEIVASGDMQSLTPAMSPTGIRAES